MKIPTKTFHESDDPCGVAARAAIAWNARDCGLSHPGSEAFWSNEGMTPALLLAVPTPPNMPFNFLHLTRQRFDRSSGLLLGRAKPLGNGADIVSKLVLQSTNLVLIVSVRIIEFL